MTLAAVWIDQRDNGSESLCFASDSRTEPGPIDGVTKVVLFGRDDVAAVWAGDYRYATLLLAHIDAFLSSSEALRCRDIDVSAALEKAKHATRRHLDVCIRPAMPAFQIHRESQRPDDTVVIVGGYSILRSRFRILRIDFHPENGVWQVRTSDVDPLVVTYIGDERKSARVRARRARSKMVPARPNYWHMEPFAAIHRAIEDSYKRSIGGIPQLAKVFKHGAAVAYGVRDPRSGTVWSRAAPVSAQGTAELITRKRLIDLSTWLMDKGQYANFRRGVDKAGIDHDKHTEGEGL